VVMQLSAVIPAEREAREPGPMYPGADGETPSQISNTGILGSRIGSLALAVRDDNRGCFALGRGDSTLTAGMT